MSRKYRLSLHLTFYPVGARSFLSMKRPERESDYSCPRSAKFTAHVELYLHTPIRLLDITAKNTSGILFITIFYLFLLGYVFRFIVLVLRITSYNSFLNYRNEKYVISYLQLSTQHKISRRRSRSKDLF